MRKGILSVVLLFVMIPVHAEISSIKAGKISGSVISSDGRPIKDCEVMFVPFGDGGNQYNEFTNRGRIRAKEPFTTTDGAGKYVSPELTEGTYCVNFSASGYARSEVLMVKCHQAEVTKGIDYKLPNGSSFVGKVTSASNNEPISKAKVTAIIVPYQRIKNGFVPADYIKYSTYTDSSGLYRIERLPICNIGEYYYIKIEHPGFITLEKDKLLLNLNPNIQDVKLAKGYNVCGSIIKADKGASGAKVIAYEISDDGERFKEYKVTYSDESGKFRFDGLDQAKTYTFFASSGDYVSEFNSADKSRHDENNPITIKLIQGGFLQIKILDEKTGKPVSNVKLNIIQTKKYLMENYGARDRNQDCMLTKMSDEYGRVEVGGLEKSMIRYLVYSGSSIVERNDDIQIDPQKRYLYTVKMNVKTD